MAVTFNIQFRISVATKVIRLTDTSSGFTFNKGCFKVEFPNGVVRNLPDFSTPDLVTAATFIDVPCELDVSGNVITGSYTVSYAVIDNLGNGQPPLVRPFNFNWVEPTNGITDFSDVTIPEVVFKDLTSYSPIGSFTGTLYAGGNTRTISSAFPSTSEASANAPITSTSTNTINVISGVNYYEGDYTPSSEVSITYAHSTNGWLSIYYTRKFSKTFSIKKCPSQIDLVKKINTYRAIIDSYKETNDTQFNILSEQYDLVIALYSHLIARFNTNTQDGSETILRELLSILEPYTATYTYQATKIFPFELASSTSNSFTISDGANTDTVALGSTLTFASGNASLVPIVTNNNVTYFPTFGTTINTFAQGNDARFHTPVTIGTANGLSISTQALSLAAATTGSAGAMSSADKTKLDGIASGATANVGTVTSVALTAPSAFTVTGSPVTTSGTLAIAASGTSLQYITGAGALATLNTANVPENTNLYFTNARSRTAISLTTTGTSGADTYDNTTGVINIPNYVGGVTSFNTRTGAIVLSSTDVTTALSFTPYNATNPAGYISSITSANVTGALGYTPENAANKGIVNGYASLDATGLVPLTQLPVTGQAGTIGRLVRNQTGATLTKGTVVYITGATGNNPVVAKAIATADATSAQTFGLCQSDIANNATGYVVIEGDLIGLDTSAFTEGQQLYLSATTAGTYTTTKQYAPNHLVYIGIITRAHPTHGQIEVKIQNGYELDEIHDVAAQTPSNNDGLFYETSTSLWKNKSIATILGYTPANAASISGTTNYVPKFTSGSSIGNSLIFDNGTNVGIGVTNPANLLSVNGTVGATAFTDGYITMSAAQINRADAPVELQYNATAGVRIFGNTSNLITFFPNGNVVIGQSPDAGYKLDVTGTARVSGILTLGSTISNGTFAYTLPSASGTLALTSALSGYLPLTGGTLTGALGGTSATFTDNIILTGASKQIRLESSSFVNFTNSGNTIQRGYIQHDGSNLNIASSVGSITLINALVGIGTNSPGQKLEVAGAGAVIRLRDSTGGVTDFGNDSVGTYWRDFSNNTFRWVSANGTERMRITSGGNVGINCAGGNARLEVVATSGEVFRADIASGAYRIVANQSNVLLNGNVLIGTSTDSGFKLDVNGTGRFSGGATVNDVFKIYSLTTSAGVVLQGYTGGLRIAVNGSGETGGARGDLLAAAADFSSTLGVTGAATFLSSVTATSYNLSALNTAPASATATGTLGEIRIDASFIYVCTATNTWKRAAITTWA